MVYGSCLFTQTVFAFHLSNKSDNWILCFTCRPILFLVGTLTKLQSLIYSLRSRRVLGHNIIDLSVFRAVNVWKQVSLYSDLTNIPMHPCIIVFVVFFLDILAFLWARCTALKLKVWSLNFTVNNQLLRNTQVV